MSPQAVARLALSVLNDAESAAEALAIARAENRGHDPHAKGDTGLVDEKWGPSIGIWQVRSLHAQEGTGRPRDATKLTNPEFNARSMASISSGGSDWSAWSTWPSPAGEHLDWARDVVASVTGEPPQSSTPTAQPAAGDPSDPSGMGWWRRGLLLLGGIIAVAIGLSLTGADTVLATYLARIRSTVAGAR